MQTKNCTDCQKPIDKLDNEYFVRGLCLSCGVDRRVLKLKITGTDNTNRRIIQPVSCIECGIPIKKLSSWKVSPKCQEDSKLNGNI